MTDRVRFQIELRKAVEEVGVSLVGAELCGRRTPGFIWQVTVNHPQIGVAVYRAPFEAGDGHYTASTLEALVARLFKAMPRVP
jgi:hypothetical protein